MKQKTGYLLKNIWKFTSSEGYSHLPDNNISKKIFFMTFKYFLSLLYVYSMLSAVSLNAQNIVPNSLYAFDKYMTNSGYAGLNRGKVLVFDIREQWLGLEASPKSYSLSFTSPIYELHGSYGVKVASISSGISKKTGFDLSYNYVFQSVSGLFSFGMGAGMYSMKLKNDGIITPGGFYSKGEVDHNDPFLSSLLASNIYLSKISLFGVYYYNDVEFGIIFDKEINVSDKSVYEVRDILRLNWQYLYRFNQNISVKAFGLIYSDFVLWQNDIGVAGLYKNNYLTGFNLRGYSNKTIDSMSFLIGGNVNYKLRLIYSYDFTISGLRKVEDGTHEIKIIYNFGKKNIKRSLPPLINNPRL